MLMINGHLGKVDHLIRFVSPRFYIYQTLRLIKLRTLADLNLMFAFVKGWSKLVNTLDNWLIMNHDHPELL